MKKSNPAAAQQSHKLPVGGKINDPGSKSSGGGTIDTGNPSVPAMDPSGFAGGSHTDLSRNQSNEPVMKPVDATTPVPPGYAQVQPSAKQPDESAY